MAEGVGYGAWYNSQKQHWLGWLAEYDGPGAYQRKPSGRRSAQFAYNHIQCAPMLLWLAEALELPETKLEEAFLAVLDARSSHSKICAALRRVIPWSDVFDALELKQTKVDRIFDLFAK